MDGGKGIVHLEDSFYHCTLCSGYLHEDSIVETYLSGRRHNKQNNAALQRMGHRLSHIVHFLARRSIAKMYGPWKDRIKALLYDFMILDLPIAFADAKEAWTHYELLERISLLELAVWKVSCVQMEDVGTANFTTMHDIMDRCSVDTSFDPNEFKRQRRYAGKLATIMRLVVPFLKPPKSQMPNDFGDQTETLGPSVLSVF